jgi:hypothetical protein
MHEGQEASDTPDDGQQRRGDQRVAGGFRPQARAGAGSGARRGEELARIAAAWKPFIQAERRELELRKDGQLAELLGAPLPGEPPEALRRLASEDRRQAEQGLVALTSNGKVFYKRVDELSPEDMPARGAAKRLRTTWLKERSDRWLGPGEETP